MATMDVGNAFPSVGRFHLANVMCGQEANLINFATSFTSGRTIEVARRSGTFGPTGLPQGSPLSPALLALLLVRIPDPAGHPPLYGRHRRPWYEACPLTTKADLRPSKLKLR